MDNLDEDLFENLQKNLFLVDPVLKATILFESRQFEHVTICISVLKMYKFFM